MIPPFPEKRAASETLFRFLHIKQPKLHSNDALLGDDKFLDYPPFIDSDILRTLPGQPSEAAGRAALETAADDFVPFSSYRMMRQTFHQLHNLAGWLETHKQALVESEISAAINGVGALSSQGENNLWDNLYYQYLRNTSEKIRDGVIRILRANNFVREWTAHVALGLPFDAQANARFQRIAGANVLLPKMLSMHKQVAPKAIDHDAALGGDAVLFQVINQAALRYQADLYEGLIEEYTAVEQEFLRASNEAYMEARRAHTEAVTALQAAATAVVDPVTGEVSYPGLVLPVFSFTGDVLLSSAYLGSRLSAIGYAAYNSHVKPHHQLLTDLLPALQNEVKAAYQVLVDSAKAPHKIVAFNGTLVHLEETPAPDRFAIQAYRLPGGRYTFFVSHAPKQLSKKLSSVTLSLGSAANPISSTAYASRAVGAYSVFQLFPEGLVLEAASSSLRLGSQSGSEANAEYEFDINELMAGQARFGNVSAERNYLDGEPGTPWINLPGIRKIGIGEYKRVEQKICCYIEGEVSHIENIMAREYKERTSRNLLQTETTIEESEEREVEKLTDTTTTDRYEMQSEISKAIEETRSQNWGASASVNAQAPGVSVQTTGYFNSTSSSSSSSNFSEAETYAKEVTQRALERIVQKVSWKRTSRVLQEFEDTNKHGFDNTQGTEHVVGIYRWVDKIYKNNLMNYGKRLMYEFMVPEPAKMFKKALENAPATTTAIPPVPPVHPHTLGLYNPSNISRSNYGVFASQYGAKVTDPLPEFRNTSLSIAENVKDSAYYDPIQKLHKDAKHYEVEVPENYECLSARAKAGLTPHGNNLDTVHGSLHLFVGNQGMYVYYNDSPAYGNLLTFSPAIEKVFPVTVRPVDVMAYNAHVLLICTLKPDIFTVWQQNAYAAVIEAYERKLQAYNDAQAAYLATVPVAAQGKDYNFNPAINRTIEIREIKRLTIELMTARFGIDTGRSNYMPFAGGYYPLRQDAAFGNHAAFARFFEQAFEWEIMSYTFHPYFWADEQDWAQLITTTSSSDFIFQSFLQAGMAQAVLPVRAGFEQSVLFFLDTGTLWNGTGFAMEDDDELYAGILGDLDVDETRVEASWTTRVPTALTIIQSNAAALEGDGLPCFCEDGTQIATGDSILNGGEPVVVVTPDPCSEFNTQVSLLSDNYNTIMSNYQLGSATCNITLSQLANLFATLKALILAVPAGCSTTVADALNDTINAQIVQLTAICI